MLILDLTSKFQSFNLRFVKVIDVQNIERWCYLKIFMNTSPTSEGPFM